MFESLIGSGMLIQITGFVAVGLTFAVFQVNRRIAMLSLMICSALLYAIHFYFLGAFTGAAMNLLGAGRNFAFIKYSGPKRPKLLPYIFIALFILATIVTWQGIKSLLPLGGMVSGTIAFWQTNPKYIRRIALISPPLWFTYNLISGSYPGMIVEVGLLVSNLIGMYRFDYKLGKKALVPRPVK